MDEFDHVLDADGDTLWEAFASLAIIEDGLAIARDACGLHEVGDFFVGQTVEDRGRNA